jgi:phage shock protein A
MGILGRLFKIGQAEANSVVDKLEDPIKLTEQGIRDMKENLDKSLRAYAEVKALSIRSRKDAADNMARATEYEQKAMLLVQRAEAGQISPEDADRLASEALARKEEHASAAAKANVDATKIDQNLMQLDGNIKKLKSNIAQFENELRTYKARAQVSDATVKINKQMSGIDSTGTVAMLEKLKTKVDTQESLAEAYQDMGTQSRSLDDEINSALSTPAAGGGNINPKGADALAALKAKMKGGSAL